MKLLVLGGSNIQLNVVKRAKSKGHTVIVSDYYKIAPAKKFCDVEELVSTFDVEANIRIAHQHQIDGVLTLGTDQPVYTAARVAQELGLPSFIDAATAKAVTNKKFMKETFRRNNIPTADFRFLSKNFTEEDLQGISFPVVVKPLDSQGQRGVYKLDSIAEIRNAFDEVLSFSREQQILVEEYYPSEEITISGWVCEDTVKILTVTDRVCFHNYPHIGVCIAHDYPSKFMKNYYDEIKRLTENITDAFKIHNGPIYYQMLIGARGIKVNEIACRIGGAYEDIFIPAVTGIDILDMLIEGSLGSKIDASILSNYDLEQNYKKLSVQMIFARHGEVHSLNDMEKLEQMPGVLTAKYNVGPKSVIREIKNATARAGYMIIIGETETALKRNIERAYKELKILDKQDNNLVINFFSERNR